MAAQLRPWTPRIRRLAPVLVAVLSLIVTVIATVYVASSARRHDEARFREAVQEAESGIQRRFETYTAILRATAGMMSDGSVIAPAHFRAFAEQLQLRDFYPGTLGIGFAARVLPGEAPELQEFMHRHGRTDFRIWPRSGGEMYPIKYLEPYDERNQRAVGFDMFSEPTRRAAMERARDTGQAAASARVRLLQEVSGEGVQPGILIYVPVYEEGGVPETLEERRERIRGFAYSPLRINDLLEGIFERREPHVDFEIYEGPTVADNAFLYDSDPLYGPDQDHRFRTTATIEVAGQPWTIVFSARPPFLDRSEMRFVPLVAIGGVLLSLFFFGITVSLSRAWASAVAAAEELERSRDEVRDLAERFRVALKNAPIIVYNTDLDLRYTWAVNVPGLQRPEQIIGKRDEDLLPEENVRELAELKRRVLRTGVGLRRTLAIRIPTEVRHYDLTVEPLRDARGVLGGLTVAAIDITEMRRAYEQFQLAAQAVRSLIYDWNAASDEVTRTDGLVDVLGFRPEEAEPRMEWWERRIHPEDRDRYVHQKARAFEHDERYVLEYRIRHRDGAWVDVWDHGILVRDPQGQVERIIGNAMNVTEWRQAQRQLLRHTDALARSNADLQDFAYIASHDLKEPLRGIANYARFLEEDSAESLDEEGRERIKTIQRLSQHMYGLLDSLLEFSRVGRTELAVGDVDLGLVIDEVVSGLEPWLEQEGGHVRVNGKLPVVRADRVRIGQVFSNLITNGIKYNRGPEKWVEIGAAQGDEEGPVLYVRDNGIGIAERHLPKLFHMFKRLHARNQYGGGTGSGLAIAKKIVERHGGRIWVESTPGQGTAFYFTLRSDSEHGGGGRAAVSESPASERRRISAMTGGGND